MAAGEHVLAGDRIELTVLPELGCHWERLRLKLGNDWVDLLRPPPDRAELRERSYRWGSYLLAPWSNRIAGATFEHDGAPHALRSNWPDGTAIHGDVRERPWQVERAGPDELLARLDTRAFPDFNYPFALTFRHSLRLQGGALQAALHVENEDQRPAPVGLGFHPYFRRRLTQADDDVSVVVSAERVYPTQGGIPTGPPRLVEGRFDLRRKEALGRPALDDVFTDLGGRPLRLIYPGTGVEVRIDLTPGLDHVVVYAPDVDPISGEEADFVALEPVSHVNDGFNLHAKGWGGTGVVVLPPGGTWSAGFTLRMV